MLTTVVKLLYLPIFSPFPERQICPSFTVSDHHCQHFNAVVFAGVTFRRFLHLPLPFRHQHSSAPTLLALQNHRLSVVPEKA